MNANDRQVGGTHYQTSFQHWDLASRFRLGYFEGQISKYFTRHRSKKGLEDAEKGLHLLEKMAEEYKFKRWMPYHVYEGSSIAVVNEYAVANKLTEDERNMVGLCVTWTNVDHVVVMLMCARRIIEETYHPERVPFMSGGTDLYVRPAPAVERAIVNAVLHTPAHHAQGTEPDGSYVNQARDDMQQFGTPGEEH